MNQDGREQCVCNGNKMQTSRDGINAPGNGSGLTVAGF